MNFFRPSCIQSTIRFSLARPTGTASSDPDCLLANLVIKRREKNLERTSFQLWIFRESFSELNPPHSTREP